MPKQFLSIFNNRPLIIQTVKRIRNFFAKDEIIFVMPEELKRVAKRYIGSAKIIAEPLRRNTGPAICLVAMKLQKKYNNAVLHIMPADHLISAKSPFLQALKFGDHLAQQGYLVTYGIKPNRPETGYGYIKIGKEITRDGRISAFKGEGFTEKPNFQRASRYLKSRDFLWNSGIFSFKITSILNEIRDLSLMCTGA